MKRNSAAKNEFAVLLSLYYYINILQLFYNNPIVCTESVCFHRTSVDCMPYEQLRINDCHVI